jgi:hypothetical protein
MRRLDVNRLPGKMVLAAIILSCGLVMQSPPPKERGNAPGAERHFVMPSAVKAAVHADRAGNVLSRRQQNHAW